MVLQSASGPSPPLCFDFSQRRAFFAPFVSSPVRFSLCPCAKNSNDCRKRERRRLLKNVRLAFLQAQACTNGGGSQPRYNSATAKGAKNIAVKRFSDENEHNSGSFSSINAASSSNYYGAGFGQDPIVDKLRNQLGIIHPLPSPPLNRSFFGLFAFFFFVGVIFDKLWTSRKTNAREVVGNKSNSRPQTPTNLSMFLERDLQRKESVEWVNMVLGKLWKVYRDGVENWIVGLLQPVIDNLKKPDYVQRVEIKQFSLGDEPLSVRSVERRTSRRVNDLQYQIGLRYSGGARMLLLLSLKFGIIPIVVPVGIRNFDIDGELWVKLRLIPKEPYVGAVSWAFVSLPRIKFELSPFRLFNLMAIPVLSMFLTKLLTEDLPKLFVRPKKIVLDFQNAKAVVSKPSDSAKPGDIQEGNNNYAGELSVTLLDARKLPYIFYGKTDPYVVLRLGDQVIRSKRNSLTTVIGPPGEPIWNQDFHMLVSNPRKEKLCIEVKDSLGFTDWSVGNAEIDLGPLKDTVPTDRIVQLRGGLSLFGKGYAGEVLLRLTYKAYVEEDEEDEKSVKAYSADMDPSEDELSDSDQSYASESKRANKKYTINSEVDSFMDVLTALLVSEEFRGIVSSDAAGGTKPLEDSGTNSAVAEPGPGPQVAESDSGTSQGSVSVLFWLSLLTAAAVLIALDMGGSSLFNP